MCVYVQVTTNARRTYVCTIGSVFCVIGSECVRCCCLSCIFAEIQQWKRRQGGRGWLRTCLKNVISVFAYHT